MRKRALSILLALSMCFALLPTAMAAEDMPTDAEQAVQTEETDAQAEGEGDAEQDNAAIAAVQAMLDALPAEMTEENAQAVGEQLDAIETAMAALSEQERAALDLSRYEAALAALAEQAADGTEQPTQTEENENDIVNEGNEVSEDNAVDEENKGNKAEEDNAVSEGNEVSEDGAVDEENKGQEAEEGDVVSEGNEVSEDGAVDEENKGQEAEEGEVVSEGNEVSEDNNADEENAAAIAPVQAMIDALPEEITEENAETVGEQLNAIAEAMAALTEEEQSALDTTGYEAAMAAMLAISIAAYADTANAATQPKGDGSDTDPYQITSVEELEWFRDKVNADQPDAWAKLMNDITFSGEVKWIPIGNDTSNYKGTFDGNHHAIIADKWTMDANVNANGGLFGIINQPGYVKNLNLLVGEVNSTVRNRGLLATQNNSTIRQCTVECTVGTVEEGFGLFVYRNGGTISNCLSRYLGTSTDGVSGFAATSDGLIETSHCYSRVSASLYAFAKTTNQNPAACYYTTGTGNTDNVLDRDKLKGCYAYDSTNPSQSAIALKKIILGLNNGGRDDDTATNTDPWRYDTTSNSADTYYPSLDSSKTKVTPSSATQVHMHTINGQEVEFTEVDTVDELLAITNGYYYLEQDMTFSNGRIWTLTGDSNVTLCLNNCTITTIDSGSGSIKVGNAQKTDTPTLTITEHDGGTGCITGTNGVAIAGGMFHLENGTIKNCTLGAVRFDNNVVKPDIYTEFRMTGGEITNCGSSTDIKLPAVDNGYGRGIITLGGDARITGGAFNILMPPGKPIQFDERVSLEDDARFGITLGRKTGSLFGSPFEYPFEGKDDSYRIAVTDYNCKDYFKNLYADDDSKYELYLRADGTIEMGKQKEHTHCVCAGVLDDGKFSGHTQTNVTFQPWNPYTHTDSNGKPTLPTSGNYYLTRPVGEEDQIDSTSVNGTLNLCLNGYDIATAGYQVGSGGNLGLTDCATAQGTMQSKGASGQIALAGGALSLYGGTLENISVKMESGDGTFDMYGGKITKNTDTAVSISNGTFEMRGGEISDNEGRAVYVGENGKFTMSGLTNKEGGRITGNQGDAAVYVEEVRGSGGRFKLSYGEITSNEGYGVYYARGELWISGGKITDNKGGGVYVGGDNFKLQGDAQIYDNQNSSGDACNVYLKEGKKITIYSPMQDGAKIGVTMAGSPGVFAGVYNNIDTLSDADTERFFSDADGRDVVLSDDKQTLSLLAHQHDWKYTATENEIKASCVNTKSTCPLPNKDGGSVGFNVTEEKWKYSGKGTAFSLVTSTDPQADGIKNATADDIKFSKADGTDLGANYQPKDVGDYVVSLTIGTGDRAATLSKGYSIVAAPLTVTADDQRITYGDAVPSYTVKYDGFVNGEDKSVLNGALTYNCAYAQYDDAKGYAITPGGLSADNYKITFKPGTLTVDKKPVTLDWQNTTDRKFNDGKSVTATATGLVNGDVIEVIVSGGEETTVGTHTAYADDFSGDKADNYKLTGGNFAEYTIGKAEAPMGIEARFEVYYDDVTPHAIQATDFNLPADAGNVRVTSGRNRVDTDGILDNGDATSFQLKYGLTGAKNGSSASWEVTIRTDNYEDITAKVTVTIVDKRVDTSTMQISQPGCTYGETLPGVVYVAGEPKWSESPKISMWYRGTTHANQVYDSDKKPTEVGSYEVSVVCETADCIYQADAKFTIAPKSIEGMVVTLSDTTFVYDGTARAVTVTGVENLSDSDYEVISGTSGTDVDTYTVTVNGKGNYTGTATATWTITPKPLTISGATAEDRDYQQGNTSVTISEVSFDGITLDMGTDYTASGTMDNADAGNKTVHATVRLAGKTAQNYKLTQDSVTTSATIRPIDYTGLQTASGSAKYGWSGTVDLSDCIVGGGTVTNISIADGKDVLDGTPTVNGMLLGFKLVDDESNNGKTATIKAVVASNNYNDYEITITLTVTDKEPQNITADAIRATYGDTDVRVVHSGTVGTVSYRVIAGDDVVSVDANGALTIRKAGNATIRITAAGDEHHAEGTKDVAVTIAKRIISIKVEDKSMKVNEALPTFTASYGNFASGDTASSVFATQPQFTTTADGKTAGTFRILMDTLPTLKPDMAEKYELGTPAEGTLSVTTTSGGGGGSTASKKSISVTQQENGTVTISKKTAYQGEKVSITVKPEDGYMLDSIRIVDESGNALKWTDEGNGRYSFVMPARHVKIEPTFVEKTKAEPSEPTEPTNPTNPTDAEQPFDDVSVGVYYYEPVKWASEKGVTGGIGNGNFGPDAPCTRAQIVTFLWRAAGSPEPKSMSSFADVAADSYYVKAVAWAVENGITGGTGDGKFSPDAICTRAQAVSFLFRALGSPAVSGNAKFSDVAADAYYAKAVAWAEQEKITGGIGDGLFGSDNHCSRAQIVTFLYRAYFGM